MLTKYVLVAVTSSALSCLLMSPAFSMNISDKLAQADAKKPLTSTLASSASSAAASPEILPAMQLDRSGADRASIHLQVLQQTTLHFADCGHDKKNAAPEVNGGGLLKPLSNSAKQF